MTVMVKPWFCVCSSRAKKFLATGFLMLAMVFVFHSHWRLAGEARDDDLVSQTRHARVWQTIFDGTGVGGSEYFVTSI